MRLVANITTLAAPKQERFPCFRAYAAAGSRAAAGTQARAKLVSICFLVQKRQGSLSAWIGHSVVLRLAWSFTPA